MVVRKSLYMGETSSRVLNAKITRVTEVSVSVETRTLACEARNRASQGFFERHSSVVYGSNTPLGSKTHGHDRWSYLKDLHKSQSV